MDEKWARWLHSKIERYNIPAEFVSKHTIPTGHPAPKRFHPSFRDRDDLNAASDLKAEIQAKLRGSHYLIVICSPHAAKSPWVNKEILEFQRLGRKDRILAMIVDGEPHSADARECFPPALRPTEPIAADVRSQGDGKTDAKLKLLSGMLGVGFDALKKRDTRRRIRRLQGMLAAALVLTLSFAFLGWYANEQRKHALEKMLDLRRILTGLTVSLYNDVDNVMGSLSLKSDLLGGSEDYLSQLAQEYSDDLGLKRDLANTHSKLGDIRIQQGKLVEARAHFDQSLFLTQPLSLASPNNALYKLDMISDMREEGKVCLLQGRLDDAADKFERSSELLATVRHEVANFEFTTRATALLEYQLALLQCERGDLATAAATLAEAGTIYETLLQQSPNNASYISELAEVRCFQAMLSRLAGDSRQAKMFGLDCITQANRVVLHVRSNQPNLRAWGHGEMELAEQNLNGKQIKDAASHAEQAVTLFSLLHQTDPEDAITELDYVRALILQSRVFEVTGRVDEAGLQFEKAVQYCDELIKIDGSNYAAMLVKLMARGEAVLGLRAMNDPMKVNQAVREYHDGLRDIATSGIKPSFLLQTFKKRMADSGVQ